MGGHGSGRNPMPQAVKLLRRDRKLTKREPVPVGALGEPPAHFDAETRAVWRAAIAHAPPGLLKQVDASVLEMWCAAHVLHRRALAEVLKADGKSPWMAVLNQQAQILLKTIDHLGFSPASRSRVAVDPGDGCGDWADVATG